jgi:hypothetical protein
MFEQDSNDPFGEQPAPVFAEYQQRTPQPKPAPVHETSAPVVTRTTATRTRQSPYRTGGQNSSQLVKRLRSAEGFRQAIAAMTVLGPPRALDPYVSDPMQSTTLGAAKRIE